MKEIWKSIPRFSDYEVSNIGRIRSYKIRGTRRKRLVPKILKTFINKNSREVIAIINYNNERKLKCLHSLVMLAFIGPRPNNMEVCHNDGNKRNNKLPNLRYDTQRANFDDLIWHNKLKRKPKPPRQCRRCNVNITEYNIFKKGDHICKNCKMMIQRARE